MGSLYSRLALGLTKPRRPEGAQNATSIPDMRRAIDIS